MNKSQPGILAPVPAHARYLTLRALPGADVRAALGRVSALCDGDNVVVGIGESLAAALGASIPGLTVFPRYAVGGIDIPSTPAALWFWLRGDDRGDLVHKARAIGHALTPEFEITQAIDAFRHGPGNDLTGYEDGTENPEDAAAVAAAIACDQGAGLDGGSFVAVQTWVHDLDRFDAMPAEQQDHTFGRRRSDNEEIDDAPPSAHVKRTAQESFTPEAFVVRRSMPWADASGAGLVFVAFGHSFEAFEALLRRMVGAEDGITDALFTFTRPVSGAYYWCPPLEQGRADFSALGIKA